MKRIIKKTASFLGGAAALIVALGASADAQTYDHLKCFKVKDSKTFKKATANLTVTSGHLAGLENCQIKPKGKEFCVPVDKSNVVVQDGTETPVAGQEHAFDRLCYKVKCAKIDVPSQPYMDQFGTRALSNFKVSTLCTPAVIGPPPVEPPPNWPNDPQDYMAGPSSYLNTVTLPPPAGTIPTCCKDFGAISRDKIEDNTDNPDNALAMLADALGVFGVDFQVTLDTAIQNGDLVMLLDHPNLSLVTLPDQFALVEFLGVFGPGTDFTLADQGLGTFYAKANSFLPGSGEPANYYHPAFMDTSDMTAGPFTLAVSLPLGFLSLEVPAQQGEIAADHGLITPAGVPYSNGTIAGYVLVDDIFGTINDILNAPLCSCLGHASDIYAELPNGTWDGNCISNPQTLCAAPEQSVCASLAGSSLLANPPQVCGILPNLLQNQSDIDLNSDPDIYEGFSIGLEFTAVNAQILGVEP